MARLAFLTLAQVGTFVIDDAIAIEEFVSRGHQVDSIPWTQPQVRWSDFDAVIVRTTWDYHEQPERFLAVLERIAAESRRFANDLALIRWNIDKRYLRVLSERGVAIVPSVWGEGGAPDGWAALSDELNTNEIVVKPTVSANAIDTFRLAAPLSHDACTTLTRTFAGRSWFAQPFLHSIATEGEYSVFYFSGVLSHCIVKVPKAGDFRVQEEHGGVVSGTPISDELRAAADAVMRALSLAPLQARVDLARLADGTLALMELELIEPSLYLRMHPDAAGNFVSAVEAWLDSPSGSYRM
jgi:glutathione synthase/RimK-type ligase-like ATP-grasp enzyme